MRTTRLARLDDRGVIAVTGPEARSFLDNLVTNDLALLDTRSAVHAALLTPQGKILYEFLVVENGDGLLLDTARASAPDLVKRLTLYRLRAKVTINDLSASRTVVAAWGGPPPDMALATRYDDPRHPSLGARLVLAPEMAEKLEPDLEPAAAWHRHRLSLGVPEAGRDYALGDTFPHEAGFDRFAGVSFTKGCFVGQEVVARMQHKSVSRKRIVAVTGTAPLTEGGEIRIGEAVIGRIGTTDGKEALALLRLDRAVEARAKSQALVAGDVTIAVDAAALADYETAIANRAPSVL